MNERMRAENDNTEDWDRLNALADGELSADEARALRKRLDEEPDLKATYLRIRGISAGLKAMRPEGMIETDPSPVKKGQSGWIWAGAFAASLIGAVFFGANLLDFGQDRKNPADVHKALVDQSFDIAALDGSQAFLPRIGSLPDLKAARLTLVRTEYLEPSGFAAHYAGVNGCRLTFFMLDQPPALPDGDGMMSHAWSYGGYSFAVLAIGMDIGKFNAVSEHLVAFTAQTQKTTTVAAVQDATRKATPCV
ncbi:MAG: hypothetical protein AAGE89_15190 [Pseudomonadota bacterium]